MMAGKRTRLLQTLTTAQLDRRRIDRQLRLLELRTIKILRGLGLEKPDQWKGYATPSEAQLANAMYCANQDIASELENTSTRDLRPTDDGIRAYRAVHALIQIRDARTHLDDNNAPRAAYAAMQAAVLGGGLLTHALTNAVTVPALRGLGGATSATPYLAPRQRCQQEAIRLRNDHRGWSASAIALQILKGPYAVVTHANGKRTPVHERTLRRWIKSR